jgi:type I restriction enzyme S subunit
MSNRTIIDSANKITEKAIQDFRPTIVPKGSLLYSLKLTVGKVAFNETDCYTNEAIFSIDQSKNVNLNFFYYSLPEQIIKNANENIYGAKILNQELIKNANLLVPSPSEQLAISHYLDRETAEIDQLIEDKKRLIELYEEEKIAVINQAVTKGINPDVPMKDSGIEWLGEIPEHWEMKRIRHVAQIFGRIGYRGYKTTDLVLKGEGSITISPSNMKNYYMDFLDCSYLSWEKYEESPEIMIFNGDILFVKTGSTYGKSSLVDKLPEKATINPQIIVLKEIQ